MLELISIVNLIRPSDFEDHSLAIKEVVNYESYCLMEFCNNLAIFHQESVGSNEP